MADPTSAGKLLYLKKKKPFSPVFSPPQQCGRTHHSRSSCLRHLFIAPNNIFWRARCFIIPHTIAKNANQKKKPHPTAQDSAIRDFVRAPWTLSPRNQPLATKKYISLSLLIKPAPPFPFSPHQAADAWRNSSQYRRKNKLHWPPRANLKPPKKSRMRPASVVLRPQMQRTTTYTERQRPNNNRQKRENGVHSHALYFLALSSSPSPYLRLPNLYSAFRPLWELNRKCSTKPRTATNKPRKTANLSKQKKAGE